MTTRRLVSMSIPLLLLAALAAPAARAGEASGHERPAIDDPRFRFLERLAGTWASEASGEMPASLFEFRPTAGGTAIREVEMLGTPMEMLTVYHMDGAELAATHYCMLGNRPRARAAARVEGGALRFDCTGTPGNAASHDDEHVHGWTMRLDERGRLHYDVQIVKQGQVKETHSMILTRQADRAAR